MLRRRAFSPAVHALAIQLATPRATQQPPGSGRGRRLLAAHVLLPVLGAGFLLKERETLVVE